MGGRGGQVRGILPIVGLVLTGCTFQETTSLFERWYHHYAETADVCEGRAQYYAGRQTPQEVTSRCRASSGPVSLPQKALPALP
jgi:hypothetical protein